MRHFFITLFLIFFITIHASEINGYKVVLASFKTFDEAKNDLDSFGVRLTSQEIELQNKYNFDIVARPSGKVFVVAIEPLDDIKTAKIISNHFKKFYPDALVSGYFGPTEGAIVWKKSDVSPPPDKVLIDSHESRGEKSESNESIGFVWKLLVSIAILGLILGLVIWRINRRGSVSVERSNYEKIKTQIFSPYGWKYDEALQRSGGNKEHLKLTLQTFLNDVPRLMNELREAFKREEYSKIQLRAHTLKGFAASVVAGHLRQCAQKLEFSAREKNSQEIESTLYECDSILNKLVGELEAASLRNNEGDVKHIGEVSLTATLSLRELRDSLMKCLFVDMARVKIVDPLLDERNEPLLAELKSFIEKLEYKKALELMSDIEKMKS